MSQLEPTKLNDMFVLNESDKKQIKKTEDMVNVMLDVYVKEAGNKLIGANNLAIDLITDINDKYKDLEYLYTNVLSVTTIDTKTQRDLIKKIDRVMTESEELMEFSETAILPPTKALAIATKQNLTQQMLDDASPATEMVGGGEFNPAPKTEAERIRMRREEKKRLYKINAYRDFKYHINMDIDKVLSDTTNKLKKLTQKLNTKMIQLDHIQNHDMLTQEDITAITVLKPIIYDLIAERDRLNYVILNLESDIFMDKIHLTIAGIITTLISVAVLFNVVSAVVSM